VAILATVVMTHEADAVNLAAFVATTATVVTIIASGAVRLLRHGCGHR
jgi:hypothetical protein